METQADFDPSTIIEVYELDSARRNGVECFLYWYKTTNTLAMTLNDEPEEKSYHFPVPNDKGNHSLRHPFAYMAQAGEQVITTPLERIV